MWRGSAVLVAALSAVVSMMVAVTMPAGAAPTPQATARTTVRFEMRPVLSALPSVATTPSTTAPVDLAAARATIAGCDVGAVVALPVIPNSRSRAPASACVVFPDRTGGAGAARYYLGPAGATATAVRRARAEFQSGQGWTIRLDLTTDGSARWDALARRQFHQQVAMVLDGKVQAAPVIQPADQAFASFEGTAVISGDFRRQEAQALAAAVNRARRRGGG